MTKTAASGFTTEASYARLLAAGEHSNATVGRIAEQIGRLIIEGDLAPGADLNSVELAKRFNTSRTPIREALVFLAMKGLVTIVPQRRPSVAKLEAEEIRDIFVVWTDLLALAARLIVKNANDDQIHDIQQAAMAQEAARQSRDRDAAFWATLNFENMIIEYTGNDALKRTFAPLRLPTLRLLRLFLMSDQYYEQAASTNDDMDRLIQALLDRNPETAANILCAAFSANVPLLMEMARH